MTERAGTLLNERYRLEAEIGRGGMGIVYRAYDTLLQRGVAVKVLSETTLGSESRARLLREAQSTAQLNHPNIVSVHDAGEAALPGLADSVPFIVMELVQGPSLYDRPPSNLEETVSVACQVCEALEQAHAHGLVHRDLKPENVLRATEPLPGTGGPVKLVDFGLAHTVASRLTVEGAILGTLFYLAPEQAQGGDVDGRADLYALGVMLYEWTAGRLPFAGDDPLVLIGQHLQAPVVPPREHNPELPRALDSLILRLLSKNAKDRPGSAQEVRQALEALGEAAFPAEPSRLRVCLPGFLGEDTADEGERRPAFVARERELARLNDFLDEALASRGRVAFVSGGPGRGKTALLDEFARRAMEAHPDLLVATGTCNAYSGVGDPYLPFREALGILTGDVEARWAAGAMSTQHARRLWQALPSAVEALLAHGPHVSPALLPGEALLARAETACPDAAWLGRLRERVERGLAGADGLQQSHLFQQVSNTLRALAEKHPLLLILDDLQWVDRTSAGLLFHLGRWLEGARILIAGAYRPEELVPGSDGERHPLDKLLGEFKREYGDVWLDLASTEPLEGRRFVDALLETEPNGLGESFRQALVERAEGHPLFTVELLRAMQERGDLVRDEEGRWVEGHALDWEALPARVEAVIAERIERLEADLRDILAVACVEGEDFTAEVVAQVRAVEARDLVRRLSGELQQQHRLVRAQGLRRLAERRLALYRFQHHLFQKYLYNHLDEVERAYLHEDVGTVLEALYGEQTDEVAVQLARHFLEAGMTDKARHYLQQAGEQAAARYANEEAALHLSRALELVPETDLAERYRLRLAREKVYEVLGQREAQRQELVDLQALASMLATEQQAEVAARQAGYALVTGDFEGALEAAETAVTLGQDAGNARLQALGHRWLGGTLVRQGDYTGALPHFETMLALARRADLRGLEALALHWLGVLSGDLAQERDYLEQALSLFEEAGDRRHLAVMLNSLGMNACRRGDYSTGWACFGDFLQSAVELGDRELEELARCNLGRLCSLLGEHAQAQRYIEQSLRISREIDATFSECRALVALGMVGQCRGHYDQARRSLEEALRLSREIGARELEWWALNCLGSIDMDLGNFMAAKSTHEEELATWERDMLSLAGLAGAALALGEMGEAQSLVAEILAELDAGEIPHGFMKPLWVYLICYRVLEAAREPRASEILAAGYRLLMENADRTPDETMRRSYLENVPWNREIMELAAALDRPGMSSPG